MRVKKNRKNGKIDNVEITTRVKMSYAEAVDRLAMVQHKWSQCNKPWTLISRYDIMSDEVIVRVSRENNV